MQGLNPGAMQSIMARIQALRGGGQGGGFGPRPGMMQRPQYQGARPTIPMPQAAPQPGMPMAQPPSPKPSPFAGMNMNPGVGSPRF